MDEIKVKVPHVGTFEVKNFKELKRLVNDENSELRIKIEGLK
jgi:hypothetical protein